MKVWGLWKNMSWKKNMKLKIVKIVIIVSESSFWLAVASSSIQVLIWEDKLDNLNNPSQDYKISFCLWFLAFLAMLEGKIREAPFF